LSSLLCCVCLEFSTCLLWYDAVCPQHCHDSQPRGVEISSFIDDLCSKHIRALLCGCVSSLSACGG
jgi:hypothetical protein